MNTQIANDLLLETKEILDDHNIEFFLISGTCLGAIRDKIILPSDTDIDIGIKHEILKEKIPILTKAFLDRNFSIDILTSQYGYPRAFNLRKNGIKICIRDYDQRGDKRFHVRINQIGDCSVYDKALFENLKKIEFLGKEFLVPNPPEEYLEMSYSNWRITDPGDHACKADIKNCFFS